MPMLVMSVPTERLPVVGKRLCNRWNGMYRFHATPQQTSACPMAPSRLLAQANTTSRVTFRQPHQPLRRISSSMSRPPSPSQCHAATIVETKKGDLVATYFGGKHERNPDVCIWVSIKKKGTNEWSKPILAADGVFTLGTKNAEIAGITAESTPASEGPIHNGKATANQRRKACWNPVITEMPNGELWLFFKVGLKVSDWTGWLCKSKDGGERQGAIAQRIPRSYQEQARNHRWSPALSLQHRG